MTQLLGMRAASLLRLRKNRRKSPSAIVRRRLRAEILERREVLDAAFFELALADFSQDWSDNELITANDDWDGVPSIVGFRGDELTTSTGVDPQTVLADNSPGVVDVIANQTAPNTLTTGGVAEFQLADSVVALNGSGTADAPYLLIHLDTTGRGNINVSYKLRDLDGSTDNSVQPVALQYRVGTTGEFTNVAAAFVADATTGPSLDTLVTDVSVLLPAAVNDQTELQLRIMTTNAVGNDEWVGVDDILVTSEPHVNAPDFNISVDAASASKSEGNSGIAPPTEFTFTVTRGGDTTVTASVDWATAGSGVFPTDASDFTGAVSGTLSFLADQTTASITVSVVGDTDIEPDEQFTVTLSNALPSGATISVGSANSTIVNDDFQPLNAGDLVITGLNATNPDQFSFVPLVDLLGNTSIRFTDNGWDEAAASPGLASTEGTVTYIAPSAGLPKGTKVIIEVNGPSTATVLTGPGTAVADGTNFALNQTGENLFAYQGDASAPNLLFGINTNSSYLTTGVINNATTYLPPALTIGASAVAALGAGDTVANVQYDHALVAAPEATLRSAVADSTKWATQGTPFTLNTTNFIIGDVTQIAIQPEGVSLAEGNSESTSTSFSFSVTRTGDVSTEQSVHWAVTGSGAVQATASDFVGGVLPSGDVTFPASSSASQTITLSISGDTTVELDETFVVTLSSPTGGALLGNATSVGTILNDDLQPLQAGDVVLTGINATNPDQFSFVPLVDLVENSQLTFTDIGWDGTALNTSEGSVVYTVPAGGVPKGTKVIVDAAAVSVPTGLGSVILVGNFALNSTGENLFVYQGSASDPNFLFAVNTNSSYLTTGTPVASTTYLPATLAIGTSAVAPLGGGSTVANAQYNHAVTTGDASTLRSLVADSANWTTQGTAFALDTTNFTVSATPAGIAVSPTSGLTTTEAGGTATFTVVLNTQPTADVTIGLSSSDTTEGTVSAAGLTFTSANWNTPQTVTVTGVDDPDQDGDVAYSIVTAAASSSDGLYDGLNASDVLVTNQDDDVAPRVSQFTPTPSGFTVLFDRPIAVGDLNLYDASTGTLGAADVMVVGSTSGAIAGSLVVSPGNQLVTFVRTGGPLAAETYTVTLRSASNGFKGATGVLLDGDGNGTGGDDYANTFAVTAGPADEVLVSIPDFARGYGQTVNLPNESSSGLPVTLSTGQNVTGVDFDLLFDSTLLSITGFSTALAGASSAFNLLSDGHARVTVSSASELSSTPGAIELGRFVASVPNTAPYGSKHMLDLTSVNVEDNVPQTRASRADDGVHVAAFVGDTSGNQSYNSGDTTLAQRIIVGSGTGFIAFQLADPLLLADINRSTSITSGDATLIQRLIVGTPVSQVPPLPTVTPPPAGGPDPRLFIPNSLTALPGETITVPVNLTVTEASGISVSGFDLAIQFDATKFTVSNLRMGSLVSPPITSHSFNTSTPGVIRATASIDTGPALAFNSSGAIYLFDLTVNAAASEGPSKINLLANFSGTVTGVTDNDINSLTLNPLPTNGENDEVDGLITIGAVASPGVTVNPTSGLTTTEAGGTATFTVVLNTQPTADVTIDLASSDTSEGTVSPTSLTFTAADWNAAQTVTVTGVDDLIDDGDIAYTIVTAAASSSDAAYHGLDASDVTASNTDNDTAGITVTPTSGLTTTEAGGTATFTVVLDSQPTAELTIDLASSDTSEGTVSPASLTFTAADWNVAQTVTVTGADDGEVDGDVAYSIVTAAASSSDAVYHGLNASDVSLTNLDNDIPAVVLNEIAVNLPGTDNPFEYIELRGAAGGLLLNVYFVSLEGDGAGAGLADMVTALGSFALGSNGLLVIKSPTGGHAVPAETTVVTDAQLDTAGGTLENGTNSWALIFSSTAIVEGSDLDTNNDGVLELPAGAVLLDAIGWSDGGADLVYGAVLTQSSGTPDAATRFRHDLTPLSAAAWYNGDLAGTEPTSLSYEPLQASANLPNGAVLTPGAPNFAPAAGVIVTPTSGLTTTEAGGAATFTVVLNTQPTADVTIGLSSSDTSEGTVSPTSLTFTSANWNVAQTVTVTGVDDPLDDGDIAYTIVTAAAVSSDAAYHGLDPSDVTASNTDNDTAGITVTPTSGLTTTEAGGAATFTVVLDSQPTADVTIGLSSSDTTEGTVSPTSLTFTSANWNVAQTVTLTGADDDVVDGNIAYTIVTAAAASSDAAYHGLNPSDVSATNNDNDPSALAPKVEQVRVNDGSTQRSMLTSLLVFFDMVVTIDPGAFTVERREDHSVIGVVVSTAEVSGKTVATLTFSGPDIVGGSLADGNYELKIASDKVHANGLDLDGDNNGTAGGEFTPFGAAEVDNFFRFFGDQDGDRDCDATDYRAFLAARGKTSGQAGYLAYFDYDADNDIDFDSNPNDLSSDQDQFLVRYKRKRLFFS